MNPEEIKALRKKLKLSQEGMGHLIGVSFTTINRWEKGKRKPIPLALAKLKQILGENNG